MDETNILLILIDEKAAPISFLDLPKEVRHRVWRTLQDDMDEERRLAWYEKPTFEFASLSLTCRQLYEELLEYRPQHLVPFAKTSSFTQQLAYDFQNKVRLQQYRSVTIQFPLDADKSAFQMLARVFYALHPVLEELHLSFHGPDLFGVPTRLHGCGYVEDGGKETKLDLHGQRIEEMLLVVSEIERMAELRILILSNMNFQLFATCFAFKNKLEYLHVTADPRSVVHTCFPGRYLFAALSMPSFKVPIKVFTFCTNAMLNASALLTRCASTIEHLTWTIPNVVLGSNPINTPLYSQTSSLLSHLALNAHRMKTLRICIAGRGSYPRNGDTELTSLRTAFTLVLGSMTQLRNLEIHLGEQETVFQYWSVGEETLRYLPHQLERFYTNDMFVSPRHLHDIITRRYLCNYTRPPPPSRVEDRLRVWSLQPPAQNFRFERFSEYRTNVPDNEQIKVWLHPTSYTERRWEDTGEVMGVEVVRSQATKRSYELYEHCVIGEDFRRTDYIPMQNGNLKFVSYQFKNPEYVCKTSLGDGETQTHMLLRLNGRLLDRERNKHLAKYGPHRYIPFISQKEQDEETASTSKNMRWSILLHELYEPEFIEPRSAAAKQANKELALSPFTDDPRYFGNENEAYKVFWDERVARPETLTPAVYPYFVDVEPDDQCHWMCPEAKVPTLAKIVESELELE